MGERKLPSEHAVQLNTKAVLGYDVTSSDIRFPSWVGFVMGCKEEDCMTVEHLECEHEVAF